MELVKPEFHVSKVLLVSLQPQKEAPLMQALFPPLENKEASAQIELFIAAVSTTSFQIQDVLSHSYII